MQAEAEQKLNSYYYDDRYAFNAKITLGWIQLLGTELQILKINPEGNPTYYIEADIESFRDYRDELYFQFGVSAGHRLVPRSRLLKHLFLGARVQTKKSFPGLFYGLEGGVQVDLKKYLLGAKVSAVRPFPSKHLGDPKLLGPITFPGFQVMFGVLLNKVKNDEKNIPNFY